MSKKHTYDVAIVGGGLAGLTLTCALARSGIKVICIDQAPAKIPANTDLRTTAISYGSQKVLEAAGIWQNLDAEPCAIKDIEILDGASPVLLEFLSAEVEGKNFGWILENSDLRKAMIKTLKGLKTAYHAPETKVSDFTIDANQGTVICADGKEIIAQVIVGADGRQSFTRGWMVQRYGLRTRQWSYKQRAVICTVKHENPHNNVAVEHFWPQGPFAVLPMADDGAKGEHRSSVVFTEHGPEANSIFHIDEKAFELALANKFPSRYGDISLIGKRASYPLGLVHAADYIAPRMVLVADAAHGIHPIAGQGLNLGFRDVKALSALLSDAKEQNTDFGDHALLQRYQRQRRPDNMAMVAVTDALNRLFSNNIMPVRVLRKAGLKAVSKLPIAKRFFMKQAMGDRS